MKDGGTVLPDPLGEATTISCRALPAKDGMASQAPNSENWGQLIPVMTAKELKSKYPQTSLSSVESPAVAALFLIATSESVSKSSLGSFRSPSSLTLSGRANSGASVFLLSPRFFFILSLDQPQEASLR